MGGAGMKGAFMAQPQRPGGFDMNRVSTGSKILLVAGLLLLIDLFLPWQSAGGGSIGGFEIPGVSFNGFRGLGILAGILAIALLVWEGLVAAGVNINMGNTSPALIGAILGGATALFTIITFLTMLSGVTWGAFIGLILALALAYGAYMRFNESKVGGGAMPPAA
jgi:hypothetical protein